MSVSEKIKEYKTVKTRKSNICWKIIIVAGSIIFTVCFLWVILFEIHRLHPELTVPFQSLLNGSSSVDQGEKGVSYAIETCYTGSPYLADALFEIPFKRTDNYICNADYIREIGEDNANLLTEKAKLAVSSLFNLSYQERDNADEVLTDLLADGISVYFADGTFTEGAADTVEKINGWFTASRTSMEGQFTTDKCMVFCDEGMVIVRGEFVFAVYNSDDFETLKDNLGMEDLENGVRKSCVMELEFMSPTNRADFSSYKLCGVNIL